VKYDLLKKLLVGHNKGIKLTAKTVDEDPAINVRSLEKRSNQPKYEEPKTRSPKTTANLIRTHDEYCFFIAVFRLAIAVFFRFTDIAEPMIGITILYHDGECRNENCLKGDQAEMTYNPKNWKKSRRLRPLGSIVGHTCGQLIAYLL